MKTARRLAFSMLLAVVLISRGTSLFAYPPVTVYDCPQDCECWNNELWTPMGFNIYCEDVAESQVCGMVLDTCTYFCETTLRNWYIQYYSIPPYEIMCGMDEFDGLEFCEIQALEPPTDGWCECECWQ